MRGQKRERLTDVWEEYKSGTGAHVFSCNAHAIFYPHKHMQSFSEASAFNDIFSLYGGFAHSMLTWHLNNEARARLNMGFHPDIYK